jgi:outer membrane cobalamin receptor
MLHAMLIAAMLASPEPTAESGDAPDGEPEDEPAEESGTPAPAKSQEKESSSEFKTVVVGQKPVSKDATGDATQVDGQKLRDSPAGSLFEALSREAADIYVTGRGVALHGVASGASGGIFIRGLGGSPNAQVLVVEDGVPDYQGIFGHPIPDAYVPFLIDRTLVIKGGDSVLYGSNAMAGVIVITSKWLKGDGYEIENDAAYGSYATLRESLSALAQSGPWGAAAAFTMLETDGHRQGTGGTNAVGQLAAQYRFPSGIALTLRNKTMHLEGSDPGPASHPLADHWFDVWRDNASLHLACAEGPLRPSMILFLNFGRHRLYDGFFSSDYTAGAIAETDLRLHRVIGLLLGLAVEGVTGEVENRVTGERPDVEGLVDFSFYNQATLTPVAPLTLVMGTRELYSTTYGFAFLYKAGLRWDIYRGLFVRSRVTRNFRQPTLRELYLPFPTANPDLKPEFSLNWDVSAGFAGEHIEISCTGYRTQAQNMIKYFGAWPSTEVVNIDKVVIWGVEGSIGLTRLGPVSLLVSGGWQDVGRYTKQSPEAKLDAELSAEHAFGPHVVAGSVTCLWVHGLYMENYGRRPLDDAFVMDVSLRYRYTLAGRRLALEPYVFLRNVLDRGYAFIEDYPMPGFNILAGLRLEV